MQHTHEPDLSTLRVSVDGDAYYLDVACRCGEEGCLGEIFYDGDDGVIRIVTNDGGIHNMNCSDPFEGVPA